MRNCIPGYEKNIQMYSIRDVLIQHDFASYIDLIFLSAVAIGGGALLLCSVVGYIYDKCKSHSTNDALEWQQPEMPQLVHRTDMNDHRDAVINNYLVDAPIQDAETHHVEADASRKRRRRRIRDDRFFIETSAESSQSNSKAGQSYDDIQDAMPVFPENPNDSSYAGLSLPDSP